MDRQLLERLIGASVLVVALVIVVPAILDGDPDGSADVDDEPAIPVTASEPRRTHTIRLDQSTQSPPVAQEVVKPAAKPAPATAKPESTPVVETVNEVKPAPKPTSAATTAKPKSEPEPKPTQKPTASARSAAPPASDPAGTESPSPSPSPSIPESGWVVQLGSFSSKQNAQRLADEVSGRGFSVFLMPLDRSGKKLYRVRVGPRDTRAQAAELAGRLARVGYTGQVTKQQPDA